MHLIHGYLGVGKTTFSRRLELERNAVRFSADEWYIRLFAGDQPTAHLDAELWRRMMSLLNDLWPVLAARGVDVILDFGFWNRPARDEARRLAGLAGADVRVYEVVCEEVVARGRCASRNADASASFFIDRAAFDDLLSMFQPLEPDEPAERVDTTRS